VGKEGVLKPQNRKMIHLKCKSAGNPFLCPTSEDSVPFTKNEWYYVWNFEVLFIFCAN